MCGTFDDQISPAVFDRLEEVERALVDAAAFREGLRHEIRERWRVRTSSFGLWRCGAR